MKAKVFITLFIILDAILLAYIYLSGQTIAVLQPQGSIALQERNLMYMAIGIMLIVVIPVFIFAYHVGTTYHTKNTKAKYTPDWDHDKKLQAFVWAAPSLVIVALCFITWHYAHTLDPRVAIATDTKPMVIQVVAMRWKWVFIYPEQGIATENYVVFPEKTPIHFELTGFEAPMNSFWIPQLGGQIYAMSGMSTQTNLIADTIGEYQGSTAEISGAGFADMRFKARSVSPTNFDRWVTHVKESPNSLTMDRIKELAKPSEDHDPADYSSTDQDLYNTIVMYYMHPTDTPSHTQQHQMEDMPNMKMPDEHQMPGS